MTEERKELLMEVDGVAGEDGLERVRAAVRALDSQAEVGFDPDHARLTVTTTAQSIEVAQALGGAGFEARDMTG